MLLFFLVIFRNLPSFQRGLSLLFFFFMFIYLEREGEKERIPSRLHTASAEPNAGLDLMKHEIMT